jgi:iron(III) transport system substrate-binding protein
MKLIRFAIGTLLACASVAFAQVPAGYPAEYGNLIAAARQEGKVVVYSVLGNKAAAPLVAAFKALYPGIEVEYDGDSGSNEVAERFLGELKAGKPSADVMWSSAMDLQMMLVRDGHAASYASPEARHLPAWARYRDQAWGTTFEPVVFVYNRKAVAEDEAPRDRSEFAALLERRTDKYAGKVAMFDVGKSGVGYLFAAQDAQQGGGITRLLRAMRQARVQESSGTGEMLAKVNSGEYLLGYNIMGAYALVRSRKELPNLGVVLPRDYTLVLSRVMFIGRHAAHPNAARLWADFMLSRRGQKIIGDAIELYAVRDDVDAEYTAAKLAQRIGAAARPIPIDPRLADDLEPARQHNFIKGWKAALAPAAAARAPVAP